MSATDTNRQPAGGDIRGYDPGKWGYSMANFAELMLPALEACSARTVAEVGAYAGDLTEVLLEWAEPLGVRVSAIDPLPQPALEELAENNPGLELIRRTSAEALRDIEMPDALVIDGDHNYHTVSEELGLVGERAGGPGMPLLLFHDVCWPHGRRDSYYAPERIPEEYQAGIAADVTIFPGEPGTDGGGGLAYPWAAATEGGPRNGVLTAIEDFVAAQPGVRLAVMPMFFGFGVAWHEDAPWADAVAGLLDRWDRDPILTRLEANRVFHLACHHRSETEAYLLRGDVYNLRRQITDMQDVLRGISSSRFFRLADRVSALRHRGDGQTWREQVERVLDESPPAS